MSCWLPAISPTRLTAGASSSAPLPSFGRLDILVNNAAFQRTYEKIEDITAEDWDRTFRTNIHAMFYLCQAAVPHLKPGAAIVNTTSIQSKDPSPQLLAYAATKGAVSNFTAGLAQMLAERGIRVNAVAPGPIWTPLIPSTMPAEKAASFGQQAPLARAGQPEELAPAFVLLASDDGELHDGRGGAGDGWAADALAAHRIGKEPVAVAGIAFS